MSEESLKSRTAIVTGSGRGIGAAVAIDLASAGANVVINYLSNEEAAQAVRKKIEDAGGSALVVQADVSTAEGADALVAATEKEFGGVDILVSNAGPLFRPVPLTEMTWDEFGGTIDQDVRCAFFTTKAVMQGMTERGYGRIVYIGSMSADHPTGGLSHHGAARAALTTFARYVAVETGGSGVTANVVAPGIVRTDRTTSLGEYLDMVGKSAPAGRVATPDDVARAVRHFAGDPDGFVTGAVFPVNGGMSA